MIFSPTAVKMHSRWSQSCNFHNSFDLSFFQFLHKWWRKGSTPWCNYGQNIPSIARIYYGKIRGYCYKYLDKTLNTSQQHLEDWLTGELEGIVGKASSFVKLSGRCSMVLVICPLAQRLEEHSYFTSLPNYNVLSTLHIVSKGDHRFRHIQCISCTYNALHCALL